MSISWIFFTLLAAFMQAWRNAFQKQLSSTVNVFGVTLARFIFAVPFAATYLFILNEYQPLSSNVSFTVRYWIYIVIAGLSQIAATALMVMLFQQKNYAIGVGLAKSEAILAAIIAVIFLSTDLSGFAWFGVALGAFAVFLLSKSQQNTLSIKTLLIGLGSGLCFAITSLLVREASLELTMLSSTVHRAAWVLVCIISFQCASMLIYLSLFQRQTLWIMWRQKGLTFRVSLCSFLASLGWFTAMSMQSVAIVKTLGQIEILFSMMISIYFFKEKLIAKDHLGLILVVCAAVLVIWA